MKKPVYYTILAVLICVFAFSAYKLGSYWMEKVRSDKVLDDASSFVSGTEDPDGTLDTDNDNETQGDPERIEVDFEAVSELNDDIVAWIYCPNTKINYPIVQGRDNDYYLYRLLDGTWNNNGTIFMDYQNSADFSDPNTLIYGHNMKSGGMFHAVIDYKQQSFYDEHPYMYIMTPEQNYRLDLFAGCVVDSIGDIYDFNPSEDVIKACIANSTFDSPIDYPTHKVVTLSTCTYEYNDARYVVLGELVPLDD
ncbi:MAG: class B sortase [Ruminococcaceae bacterium]|nr:class B sortase [Oscillospiraceae bacterium]